MRALLAALVLLTGCNLGTRPDDPDGVVELFVAATRNGDREAVYQHLGPRTRARLQAAMKSAQRVSGRMELKPHDFLSVGRAPPAWEPSSIRTLQVEGGSATVLVQSTTGDRHDLQLVLEDGAWKLELPGP